MWAKLDEKLYRVIRQMINSQSESTLSEKKLINKKEKCYNFVSLLSETERLANNN